MWCRCTVCRSVAGFVAWELRVELFGRAGSKWKCRVRSFDEEGCCWSGGIHFVEDEFGLVLIEREGHDDFETAQLGAGLARRAGSGSRSRRASAATAIAGDGACCGSLGPAHVPGSGLVAEERPAGCAIGVCLRARAWFECPCQVHVLCCELREGDRAFSRQPELPRASRFVHVTLLSTPSCAQYALQNWFLGLGAILVCILVSLIPLREGSLIWVIVVQNLVLAVVITYSSSNLSQVLSLAHTLKVLGW